MIRTVCSLRGAVSVQRKKQRHQLRDYSKRKTNVTVLVLDFPDRMHTHPAYPPGPRVQAQDTLSAYLTGGAICYGNEEPEPRSSVFNFSKGFSINGRYDSMQACIVHDVIASLFVLQA